MKSRNSAINTALIVHNASGGRFINGMYNICRLKRDAHSPFTNEPNVGRKEKTVEKEHKDDLRVVALLMVLGFVAC
jgi:hypothetical protein